MRRIETGKLTVSGLMLAVAMFLPLLTGQIPEVGRMLGPMHLPALLCGLICGWPYGLAVGFVSPPLRYLLFGMPPIYPMGLAMAFELATYGAVAGLLYAKMGKRTGSIFVALIAAMVLGRVVYGPIMWLLSAFAGNAYTFQMFLAAAFVEAWPGIIAHIVIVPAIMIALKRNHLA